MIGLLFVGVFYLVMVVFGVFFGIVGKVSLWWLVVSWVVVEIVEMLILLIGLLVIIKFVLKVFVF